MKRKILAILVAVILLAVAATVLYKHFQHNSQSSSVQQPTAATASTPQSQPASNGFNKKQYSLDDPASIWVVVNKKRPLQPASYVPKNLVVPNIPLRVPGNESMQVTQQTAAALQTMFAAAKSQGLNLMLSSGYRSYTYQVNLYNGYVQNQGQAAADAASARPGHSEHQTGFAADLEPASRECELDKCFADTPEGKWLASNAYLYGFIIRYPADKVPVTGYEYEPWHVRYIGTDLSKEMHQQGVTTLEEFFGLGAAPGY